jgi:hypothetical protein
MVISFNQMLTGTLKTKNFRSRSRNSDKKKCSPLTGVEHFYFRCAPETGRKGNFSRPHIFSKQGGSMAKGKVKKKCCKKVEKKGVMCSSCPLTLAILDKDKKKKKAVKSDKKKGKGKKAK